MATAKPKTPSKRTRQGVSRTSRVPSVFAQFHCVSVSYRFAFPAELFDSRAFTRITGIKSGEQGTTISYPKDPLSGYHVHLKTILDKKVVSMFVDYYDGAVESDGGKPYAESVMAFVGLFVREPSSRAIVYGEFRKPHDTWKSRFNLPFKVTMAGAEVVIDGVSLILPRNPFRATDGSLTMTPGGLWTSVRLTRSVEFATFNLNDELTSLNEAVKMFAEQVK